MTRRAEGCPPRTRLPSLSPSLCLSLASRFDLEICIVCQRCDLPICLPAKQTWDELGFAHLPPFCLRRWERAEKIFDFLRTQLWIYKYVKSFVCLSVAGIVGKCEVLGPKLSDDSLPEILSGIRLWLISNLEINNISLKGSSIFKYYN